MMKIEKGKFIRIIIITVCMTVAVVGILFSVFCKVTGRSLIKGEDYAFVKKIMSKYGKLYAIQEKMNRDGYFKVSESRQMDAIYKGLVKSLKDPYSEYFTAGEAKEWNSRLNGTFFGIGVIFAQDKKGDFIIGRRRRRKRTTERLLRRRARTLRPLQRALRKRTPRRQNQTIARRLLQTGDRHPARTEGTH